MICPGRPRPHTAGLLFFAPHTGIHPFGWLARNALDVEWAVCEVKFSAASMARELQQGVLAPYQAAVESGGRFPGSTLFSLPFLAC